MGSWFTKPKEARGGLRDIVLDRYVEDWDWDDLQNELESALPLVPDQAPERLKTMRCLFVCCMANSPTLQARDLILHILRSIDFESELCRLEYIDGSGGLLSASWGMHFRAIFKGEGCQDVCCDYAVEELEGMTAQGISVTFPVHFDVVSSYGAVFDFEGLTVAENFEVTVDEARSRYDFVDPADRADIVGRLWGIRATIESEARSMQVPSEQLWHHRRCGICLNVTPAESPEHDFIPYEENLLVQLTRGKRFRRMDIVVAVDDKPAVLEAVDLVSIAKMVASDEAIEMWKKWKSKGAGAGIDTAVSDGELDELAAGLADQLGKPEVVEDVVKVGDWRKIVKTKFAGLEGLALATFKAFDVSPGCQKGPLWDYVLYFLRWIGFPGDGCFLERTFLSRATFLSASAGMHIRVFFSFSVPEFMVELLAVGHLTKLAEQVALGFPVPFYVVNADVDGGFSFRVFWVSKELQVLGWRGLFDSEKYFVTDARQRGLIASIFAAMKRRIAAEHQQLTEQGIGPRSPRSVTMDGEVERVEVATTVHAEGVLDDCDECASLKE